MEISPGNRTAVGQWKAVVDRERCVGAGVCALTAPLLFDQDPKDGRVVLLEPRTAAHGRQAAEDAAEGCPSGAVTVESQGGLGDEDDEDDERGGAREHPRAAPPRDLGHGEHEGSP
ncbi:ferredoxin [Streptomyces sp. PU-14G]|uniref:ferredoxin n=1 Tax=Streptomyces sp. PU-14G TaxID=2800808 RepID=UPI0034DFA869